MRSAFWALSLAGFTVLASAGDAQAQRRGYGGWGGGYYPQSRYYNSYYGGGVYSPYYNPYYGGGVYSPYYQGNSYGPSLSYYYPEYAPATPPAQVVQSFYSGQETAQPFATVTVMLPTADAQVWFGNTAMTPQGMERVFHSPSLEPGKTFVYAIKARWMENGTAVERDRQVNVQAGQRVTVNFRDMAR